MKVASVSIKNFRRLEDIHFALEADHTVLVGPNNSGKTSATAAIRTFKRPGNFTINDFTVSCIKEIDRFGGQANADASQLPAIQLDLWMTIDPDIEFGRVWSLLPNISTVVDKVGIRLRYCVKSADELKSEYALTFPESEGQPRKTLSHFLAMPNALSRHFAVKYYALEQDGTGERETEIEQEEGKRVFSSLVRVDFIDAQRNIHDNDDGRHNRLSAAFAAYYKHNLEKPAENEEANKVIDENNSRLTRHYEAHFKPLLKTISSLGVPSAHDRTLRLVSSLSAQDALQGSTELFYVDSALQHELPEAYNGLGFKNLVYMAIQISHFHAQWLATEKSRELCQLIFVEEPEVHLHAQVQQIFISNIWAILNETATNAGEQNAAPQLVLSTHSSHIVNTVQFEKIRYFRRCRTKSSAPPSTNVLNATAVLNLADFSPSVDEVELADPEKEGLDEQQLASRLAEKKARERDATLSFLKKYIKLTHCDLFFADAAILVEGTVEKLLLSQMIEKSAKGLQTKYLTVLEIGGAYAHKFSSLMAFLGIPYVVVTDIDTVSAEDARRACPASQVNARTSNAALKYFFSTDQRADLVSLTDGRRELKQGACFVTYQKPVSVFMGSAPRELHGRTLEETFVYENLALFRNHDLDCGVDISTLASPEQVATAVYDRIRDAAFKKTDFALHVASSSANWETPTYIRDGLVWLERKLSPAATGDVAAPSVASV